MYKHHGVEGTTGLGNGMVSKASQDALRKGEALAAQRRPREALPYYFKAMEDPNNLDADIAFSFVQPNLQESLRVLQEAEERGQGQIILKRRLGNNVFDDDGPYVGSFWQVPETRPYMRVLQATVKIGFLGANYDAAANAGTEMMRLCPGDNLGARQSLGSMLLHTGRSSDALSFAQAWLANDGSDIPKGGTIFKTPSERPLPEARAAKLKKWSEGNIAYTAALASFRLSGDCAQSRQYLAIAAATNPQVVTRIVGKVTKPDELNNSARAFNGPEDAHDYLYWTQDLWMTPGVYKWVSENEDVKAIVLKSCSGPGCENRETKAAEFKRCTACRTVHYCSQECQTAHWKDHKKKCKEVQDHRKMNRLLARPGKSIDGLETIKPENVYMMDMTKIPGGGIMPTGHGFGDS